MNPRMNPPRGPGMGPMGPGSYGPGMRGPPPNSSLGPGGPGGPGMPPMSMAAPGGRQQWQPNTSTVWINTYQFLFLYISNVFNEYKYLTSLCDAANELFVVIAGQLRRAAWINGSTRTRDTHYA